jgi:sec-independent protein translocase protein TatA
MGSIGMPELIIILVICLIIFGAGKLPQIGENMGKAIRNFKSATEKEKFDVTPKKPDELSEAVNNSRFLHPSSFELFLSENLEGRVYACRARFVGHFGDCLDCFSAQKTSGTSQDHWQGNGRV